MGGGDYQGFSIMQGWWLDGIKNPAYGTRGTWNVALSDQDSSLPLSSLLPATNRPSVVPQAGTNEMNTQGGSRPRAALLKQCTSPWKPSFHPPRTFAHSKHSSIVEKGGVKDMKMQVRKIGSCQNDDMSNHHLTNYHKNWTSNNSILLFQIWVCMVSLRMVN